MNLVYVAQFHETCGYSHAAIGYLKSIESVLSSHPEINFKILSISLDPKKLDLKFHENRTSPDVLALFDKYHFKTQQEFDQFLSLDYHCLWHMTSVLPIIVNSNKIMNYYNNIKADLCGVIKGASKNFHILAWETDTLSQEYQSCIDIFDPEFVFVPSEWNHKTISKVCKSVLLPHLIEDKNVDSNSIGFLETIKEKFIVLAVSEWTNRKNFSSLIRAFILELSGEEDTALVIKTSLPPGMSKDMFLKEFEMIKKTTRTNFKPKQNIYVILEYLSDQKMKFLYETSTIFCLTSYGEGFSLPTSEAVLAEKPVLCPDSGGHVDYLDKNSRYLFSGFWDTVFDHPPYDSDAKWYIPLISDVRQKMKLAYEDWKSDNGELQKAATNNSRTQSDGCFSRNKIGKKLLKNILQSPNEEKSKINKLKKVIANKTLKEKLEVLKDSYKGEACYILNCGPSLSDNDPEKLKSFLSDKLVFSVKQAYDLFSEITDFHFFNCSNLPDRKLGHLPHYRYGEDTLSISSSNYDQYRRWSALQLSDIFFKIPIRTEINNEFLVRTGKIDEFLMSKSLTRPCGPGIMYETVLFMAIHLGVSSITCIGWDLTDEKVSENNYEHFYGSTEGLINRGDILSWEIEETRKFSKSFYNWCRENGIDLNIASDKSSLYEGIPRINLEL